jgi:hypothetical protein
MESEEIEVIAILALAAYPESTNQISFIDSEAAPLRNAGGANRCAIILQVPFRAAQI